MAAMMLMLLKFNDDDIAIIKIYQGPKKPACNTCEYIDRKNENTIFTPL